MSLLDLPNELLTEIATQIPDPNSLNALLLTNRKLHQLLAPLRWRRNVDFHDAGILPFQATAAVRLAVAGGPEALFRKAVLGNRRLTARARALGDTVFLKALEHGRGNLVRVQLANDPGLDAEQPRWDGETLLFRAVRLGNEDVVAALLESDKVNAMAKTQNGRIPLHDAARLGHVGVTRLLLAVQGLNPDVATVDTLTTPFSAALRAGSIETAKLLYATGRVDVQSQARPTPMSMAITANQADSVAYLLSLPEIDPNFRDNGGPPPLIIAILENSVEALKLLIHTGRVDVMMDWDGSSPLDQAARYQQPEIVKVLLKHYPPDAPISPHHLSLASGNGDEVMTRLLLAHQSVDVNALGEDGLSPLHNAVMGRHTVVIDLLLANDKVDVNLNIPDAGAPLHCAVSQNNLDLVRKLLCIPHLDPEVFDMNGRTPLDYALESEPPCLQMSELLLNRSEVIRAFEEGRDYVLKSEPTKSEPMIEGQLKVPPPFSFASRPGAFRQTAPYPYAFPEYHTFPYSTAFHQCTHSPADAHQGHLFSATCNHNMAGMAGGVGGVGGIGQFFAGYLAHHTDHS